MRGRGSVCALIPITCNYDTSIRIYNHSLISVRILSIIRRVSEPLTDLTFKSFLFIASYPLVFSNEINVLVPDCTMIGIPDVVCILMIKNSKHDVKCIFSVVIKLKSF